MKRVINVYFDHHVTTAFFNFFPHHSPLMPLFGIAGAFFLYPITAFLLFPATTDCVIVTVASKILSMHRQQCLRFVDDNASFRHMFKQHLVTNRKIHRPVGFHVCRMNHFFTYDSSEVTFIFTVGCKERVFSQCKASICDEDVSWLRYT